MLIRSHKTTRLQIFCKHSLNSQVIFKSIKVADDILYRNSECEWVKLDRGSPHVHLSVEYTRMKAPTHKVFIKNRIPLRPFPNGGDHLQDATHFPRFKVRNPITACRK